MKTRHLRPTDVALAVVAATTLASLLACIRPRTMNVPPNDEYPEQPTATADSPAPDDAPPAAPTDETPDDATTRQDPLASACERDSAQACVDFALPRIASSSASISEKERASRALGKACSLGRGDACYVYGLMIWLSEGGPYDRDELSYALGRAEELGYSKARVSYKDLVLARPDANATANPDLLYHYKQACDLGIRRACSYFSVLTNNQPVELPIPEPAVAGDPTKDTPADTPPADDTPPPPDTPPPADGTPATTTTPAATTPTGRAPTSTVTERGLLVTGGLSFPTAYQVVDTHRPQIAFCYEKRLMARGPFAGELIMTLEVAPDGSVSRLDTMSSTLDDAETLSCIRDLARLWRFPATKEASRLSYRAELGAR
jgi:hypothetical protein